jgi:hypothetical protein
VLYFDSTTIQVSGYAQFTFTTFPTQQQLAAAGVLRDQRVVALTTNMYSILGSVYPAAVPNCACDGENTVTQLSSQSYSYATTVLGVPGFMQCGARLIYSDAGYKVVGVDDGSTSNGANLGKFCSSIPVTGGVTGTPGSSSCKQYGVMTQVAVNFATAAVGTMNAGRVFTITVTAKGEGYTDYGPPPVTIGAPDVLAADPIVTYNTGSGNIIISATGSNGPYNGPVLISSYTGATCIDTTNTGANLGTALCTGTQGSITIGVAIPGATCTGANLAPTGMPVNGAMTLVGPFTVNTGIKCSAAPILTLSNSTLQAAVQATAVATVENGLVTSIYVNNVGSGYRTTPSVYVGPPQTSSIGKLCSPTPIAALSFSVGYSLPLTISTTGFCQPIGRDTYLNRVCSTPAVPGGVTSALNVYTCNVLSSFRAQPTASATSACGILAQSFISYATLPPPSPPPAPPAPPSSPPPPTPPPSPPVPPTPPSTPPPRPPSPPRVKTCRWVGNYIIESVACPGRFIAFNTNATANGGCNNGTIMLRTGDQSRGNKKLWQFNGAYTVGAKLMPSGIISTGRYDTCPRTPKTHLGAQFDKTQPVITSKASFNIIPVNVNFNCAQVYLQYAGSGKYSGKYVAHGNGDACKNEGAFSWAPKSSSSTLQWRLRLGSA